MADIDTMTEDTENTEDMDARLAAEAAAEAEKQAERAHNLERGKVQTAVVLAVTNALRSLPELKGAQLLAVDAGADFGYVHIGRIRFVMPDGEGLEVTVHKDTPKSMYWGF